MAAGAISCGQQQEVLSPGWLLASVPLAGLTLQSWEKKGDGVEATTAEHYPTDNTAVLGCWLCSDLIHELQMDDVTGSVVPCHLVIEFVSDASQFET